MLLFKLNIHMIEGDGMDLINCKCFAPLYIHFNYYEDKGIFISVPCNNGLDVIIFIFNLFANAKRLIF